MTKRLIEKVSTTAIILLETETRRDEMCVIDPSDRLCKIFLRWRTTYSLPIMRQVGFNFDGTLALTGSYDGTVRIWDVRSFLKYMPV
jgi:WD40 repeat protein